MVFGLGGCWIDGCAFCCFAWLLGVVNIWYVGVLGCNFCLLLFFVCCGRVLGLMRHGLFVGAGLWAL